MSEDLLSPYTIDAQKILDFLSANGGRCSVEDLKLHSGADPLRLYPAIYRLSLSNHLKIMAYDSWGAPVSIMINYKL